MMAGAGIIRAGRSRRADADRASTSRCERSRRAAEDWGERFAPPLILRRLVAQGRLGQKSRPGLLPLPAARRRLRAGRDGAARDAAATSRSPGWTNPPANSISPAGDRRPRRRSGSTSTASARPRAGDRLVATRCSSAPAPTSRRSRRWTRPAGAELLDGGHALLREMERSGIATIAAVNAHRLRRRLRAGDGLRRAHRRRVGDLRPARDQPRDHPRLRRHPAPAAARRREQGARDEPRPATRSRPTRPTSSASSTASCRTTSCSTPRSRGRASSPARRRSRSSRSSRSPPTGDLDEGIEAEKEGFATAFGLARTRKEGIGAFLGKREPQWSGQ